MPFIVVAGAIANKPFNGGEAWVRLSWALGFQRIGCEVFIIEQIASSACSGEIVEYFRRVVEDFGLAGKAALIDEDGKSIFGPGASLLADLAGSADLLVNISGHLRLPRLLKCFKRKAYVDIDPGFTQFWFASNVAAEQLLGHDVYFTIGRNIGLPTSPIPTGGIDWHPVSQPVVLDDWPLIQTGSFDRFTTVATWRGGYGPIVYDGRKYTLKVHEFRKLRDLPRRCGRRFEIALNIDPADAADRRAMLDAGWVLVDPRGVAGDPAAFRDYVQGSSAEFSCAQGIYVQTQSGWFSDRSVRYLASGKPVLVQDTGLSGQYAVGEGLLTFRTIEEAAAGAEEIAGNYPAHCAAARAVAERYFDARKVLPEFLEQAGVSAPGVIR
jgi:hypothetical protein